MNAFKLTQYQYESDGWKRLLYFMTEETVYAKNRIAAVLKEPIDINVLNGLENYQTGFIEKDALIATLRNEIGGFDKLLLKKTFEDDKNNRLIHGSAKKIKRKINFAEQAYNSLQKTFNKFVSENI